MNVFSIVNHFCGDKAEFSAAVCYSSFQCHMILQKALTVCPWTTKQVIRVNFSKLRFILNLKAEQINFTLMYVIRGLYLA